jgi:hypothetical protein
MSKLHGSSGIRRHTLYNNQAQEQLRKSVKRSKLLTPKHVKLLYSILSNHLIIIF